MPIEDLKTIGILGGMSSAATGEYYKLINQKVNQMRGGHTIAELLILSVNFANIERFVRSNDWKGAAAYLAGKAQQLEAAGASCLFLGTNTMHRVRQEIQEAISIPFIDIFETVSQEIRAKGKSKIGLLGTYPVMNDPFFREAYWEHGVDIIGPEEEEKKKVDRIIFDELTAHQFLPESKSYFIEVMKKLAAKGAEGIILGCTEIKLLVSQQDIPEVQLFDTTELHCQLAADICTGLVSL